MNMDELLEILQDLHPDVDFETCDELVDAKIIDSFDIFKFLDFLHYILLFN